MGIAQLAARRSHNGKVVSSILTTHSFHGACVVMSHIKGDMDTIRASPSMSAAEPARASSRRVWPQEGESAEMSSLLAIDILRALGLQGVWCCNMARQRAPLIGGALVARRQTQKFDDDKNALPADRAGKNIWPPGIEPGTI